MFQCTKCGYKSVKWLGRCPVCEEWESFEEEKVSSGKNELDFLEKYPPRPLKEIQQEPYLRTSTGWEEFDRVLGGGLVKGEVVLVGGVPGVGKSTLLLQVASSLSGDRKVLYVSAEESVQQVNFRARRLGADGENLYILNEDDITAIYRYITEGKFDIVIVDSIQVVHNPHLESLRGSPNQLRACTEFFTRMAKSMGVVVILVGHVTKEGIIAGPKLLEHIVDCVLYFETEPNSPYRLLRAAKNRFGSTGEMAVFEMTSQGLKEVKVLSDIFLPHKKNPISGSCIACVIEGIKPILLELQALVTRSNFGMVRRRSLGFDFNRMSLLVAIIEKRLKMSLSTQDIFLNVAGGIKITDPAADLAALVAIVSSFKEEKIGFNTVFIGEVGLGGELRPVSNINMRLKEVLKGGFEVCFIPEGNKRELEGTFSSINIIPASSIKDVLKGGG